MDKFRYICLILVLLLVFPVDSSFSEPANTRIYVYCPLNDLDSFEPFEETVKDYSYSLNYLERWFTREKNRPFNSDEAVYTLETKPSHEEINEIYKSGFLLEYNTFIKRKIELEFLQGNLEKARNSLYVYFEVQNVFREHIQSAPNTKLEPIDVFLQEARTFSTQHWIAETLLEINQFKPIKEDLEFILPVFERYLALVKERYFKKYDPPSPLAGMPLKHELFLADNEAAVYYSVNAKIAKVLSLLNLVSPSSEVEKEATNLIFQTTTPYIENYQKAIEEVEKHPPWKNGFNYQNYLHEGHIEALLDQGMDTYWLGLASGDKELLLNAKTRLVEAGLKLEEISEKAEISCEWPWLGYQKYYLGLALRALANLEEDPKEKQKYLYYSLQNFESSVESWKLELAPVFWALGHKEIGSAHGLMANWLEENYSHHPTTATRITTHRFYERFHKRLSDLDVY